MCSRDRCWSWFGRTVVVLWSLTGWAFITYLYHFYLSNPEGHWKILPNLNGPEQKPLIYLHIVGATLILLLGPFQMLNNVYRTRIHRWTGVIYALGCLLSSLAGLGFIILNGTGGGVWMTLAFSLSGTLIFILTLITIYFALWDSPLYHRAWAIRLYALASSSVFYRALYFGVVPLLGLPHWRNFQAPLDVTFDWLYFLVPMAFTELYLRIRWRRFYCCPTPRPITEEDETLIGV